MVILAGLPAAEQAHEADSGARQADAGPVQPTGQAPGALAHLRDPAERAHAYAGKSKSAATIRAYAAGWRDFLGFCKPRGASALPADDQTVAAYLADMADRGAKAATIARRLVVISQAHKAADLPSPTTSSLVSRTHAGIRRTLGTAQSGKARPGRRPEAHARPAAWHACGPARSGAAVARLRRRLPPLRAGLARRRRPRVFQSRA